MKHDLTTGTWQDDTGCPISFVLAATSDATGMISQVVHLLHLGFSLGNEPGFFVRGFSLENDVGFLI